MNSTTPSASSSDALSATALTTVEPSVSVTSSNAKSEEIVCPNTVIDPPVTSIRKYGPAGIDEIAVVMSENWPVITSIVLLILSEADPDKAMPGMFTFKSASSVPATPSNDEIRKPDMLFAETGAELPPRVTYPFSTAMRRTS